MEQVHRMAKDGFCWQKRSDFWAFYCKNLDDHSFCAFSLFPKGSFGHFLNKLMFVWHTRKGYITSTWKEKLTLILMEKGTIGRRVRNCFFIS